MSFLLKYDQFVYFIVIQLNEYYVQAKYHTCFSVLLFYLLSIFCSVKFVLFLLLYTSDFNKHKIVKLLATLILNTSFFTSPKSCAIHCY